jgi:hypothetical protein
VTNESVTSLSFHQKVCGVGGRSNDKACCEVLTASAWFHCKHTGGVSGAWPANLEAAGQGRASRLTFVDSLANCQTLEKVLPPPGPASAGGVGKVGNCNTGVLGLHQTRWRSYSHVKVLAGDSVLGESLPSRFLLRCPGTPSACVFVYCNIVSMGRGLCHQPHQERNWCHPHYFRQGLAMQPRLIFNSRSSCLSILSAGITSMCYGTRPGSSILSWDHLQWDQTPADHFVVCWIIVVSSHYIVHLSYRHTLLNPLIDYIHFHKYMVLCVRMGTILCTSDTVFASLFPCDASDQTQGLACAPFGACELSLSLSLSLSLTHMQ